MKKRHYIILLLTVFSLESCKYFELKKQEAISKEVVASVGDKKLYKSDLNTLYTPKMTSDDSLKISQNYIESWARRQIILDKAKFNLTDAQESVLEEMMQRYKEDLYINSYKEALVSQNLDSVVTNDQIEQFYLANHQIFRLKETLIQYRLLSFSKNDRKKEKMIKLFQKNDSTSIANLLNGDFLYEYVELNDSVWSSIHEFYQKYPQLDSLDRNKLKSPKQYISYNSSKMTYYIYINKVLNKGEVSPLERVSQDVVKMLYHQKKLKYLQDLDSQLIKEAIDQNTFQKY